MSVNKVILVGRLGKDAELKYTAKGDPKAQFSIATDYGRGESKQTEWTECVLWGDQAEKLSQYLTKGKLVFVEGRLQTRKWEDDHGVRHFRTEVVVSSVQLLGKTEGEPRKSANADVDIDDLPFE